MPSREAVLLKEFRTIRTSFRQLARSISHLAPMLAGVPHVGAIAAGVKPSRKKPRLSRAYREAHKLQSKYMGTMRGLSARRAAKVKRIRAAKGIRAAIAAARADNGLPQAVDKTAREKRTLSPSRLRSLKLQGGYMGTMRGLPEGKSAKFKKVRAAKGIRAAIAAAERMTP